MDKIHASLRRSLVRYNEYTIFVEGIIDSQSLPTIILSGPASTSVKHYWFLMKELNKQGFNVIAFDMPGHGTTFKNNHIRHGDFRAKDLEEVPFVVARHARKIFRITGPLILLLSSLSAIYGIRGLAKQKEKIYDIAFFHCVAETKEEIKQFLNHTNIFLFNLAISIFFPFKYWPLKNLVDRLLVIPMFVKTADTNLRVPFLKRFPREVKMTGFAIKKVLDPSVTHFFTLDTWKSLIDIDDVDFRQIKIPVYVLVMSEDALFTPKMAEEFSKNIPDVTLLQIKGNHLIFTDNGLAVQGLVETISQAIKLRLDMAE